MCPNVGGNQDGVLLRYYLVPNMYSVTIDSRSGRLISASGDKRKRGAASIPTNNSFWSLMSITIIFKIP